MNWLCAYGFSIIGAFWVLVFGVFSQRDVSDHSVGSRFLLVLILAILWPVSVPFVLRMAKRMAKGAPSDKRHLN